MHYFYYYYYFYGLGCYVHLYYKAMVLIFLTRLSGPHIFCIMLKIEPGFPACKASAMTTRPWELTLLYHKEIFFTLS